VVILAYNTLRVAARAVREMKELGADYEERLAHFRQQERERQQQQQATRMLRATQMADLRKMAESFSSRCARLAGLLQENTTPPAAPQAADVSLWSAYVRQLEALHADMEARMLARARTSAVEARMQAALAAAGDTPTMEDITQLYLEARQAQQGEADAAKWRAWVKETLARLNLSSDEALPAHLEARARAVILAENPIRAELLADELRREIQIYRQTQAQIAADAADATEWLEILTTLESAAAPEEDENLRLTLQAVISGLLPLDATTRKQAKTRIAALKAKAHELEMKAAAVVLEQSLQDLGYQVEPVRDTLFAEGGIVHFQRPGWGKHFVRLRVHAGEQHLNFNVVRARAEAADSYAASEQKRQDFMAEERWCAEFPRLMATLAARGMEINVTRRLQAGELPVQEVDAERLPDFTQDTEQRRPQRKAQHMK
jgi:hypothetical protein